MITIAFIITFSIAFTMLIEPINNIKIKYKLFPEFTQNIFLFILYKLINCSKCLSFQLSIFILHNFMLAIIIMVITEYITRQF